MSTNSKIGKIKPSHRQVLPWNLKSVSNTRQDIQSWRRALAMFQNVEQPTNWVLQLLYNNIKLDALLSSQIENRKDQTFSSDFVIKTSDDKDDEEVTKVLSNSIAFAKIIEAIIDSKFHGYSMIELHIDQNGKLQVEDLPRTNIIPQKGLFFKDYMEVTGGTSYREIKEYGTFILEFDNLSLHEQDFGLFNKIVPHVLMKRFAQSCWSELCEIYGIPPRYLKTMTNDPGMMARGEQMMRDMGAASGLLLTKKKSFQFAQGVSTNGDVYKQFINLCNNEISLLVSGAIIGQDTANGSRSKDEASQEMLWQKVLADQRFIIQIVNEKVLPAFERHGLVKKGSYMKYNEAEDTNKLFEFATKLMNHKDVPNEWIEEKFGVPVVDKKADSIVTKKEEKTNRRTSFKFFRLSPLDQSTDLGGLALHAINSYYCCDSHNHIELSSVGTTDFGKYLEKLAKELWEKKALERSFDPVLIQSYGENLSKAIDKGYLVSDDFSTADQKKIHALKNNVWQFSTAKTYTQLKQMSEALIKPDGTMRTFEEFRIQTTLITGEHLRHLKTEYNTAVAGAQMASKWEDTQRLKDTYPLLQFIAVEDVHTTALCRSLDLVIKPVDDPFWMQFYPPNHYNCRSTVKKLRKGDITPDDQVVKPLIPEIFKVNLGERGLAFPEDHAYFDGMPIEIYNEARQHFPYAMQLDICDISDDLKGIVRQHFMADTTASDYQRVLEYATKRAREDKINVDIMPTLGREQDRAQRSVIFPDSKLNKSPDLRIDKVLWEEEQVYTNSRRAIKGAIEAGANQANNVIVNINNDLTLDFELKDIVKVKFKDYPELKTVIFRYKGKEYRYNRS